MFTGIVQQKGRLIALKKGITPKLSVEGCFPGENVKTGDSVAVNGACLTVVSLDPSGFTFNLSGETLEKSNFSDLSRQRELNLELPLKLQDFLGGHLVSGHLDGTARLKSKTPGQGSSRLVFLFKEKEWRRFLIPKGSVTVNGVSLTLAKVEALSFTVDIIPRTLATTNLREIRSGERVNIELDLIGKYLYNFTLNEKKNG